MVRCTECGSQYFREVHRLEPTGNKVKLSEKEHPVQQCANCGHMMTIQEGLAQSFTEARQKPRGLLDDAVSNPVER